MKNLLTIVLLVLLSCSSKKTFISKDVSSKVDCSSYNVKNENQISWSKRLVDFKFINTYNEIKFCTHHPTITAKIVYDEFGKWSTIAMSKKNKSHLLIWNDINIEGIDYVVNLAASSYDDKYSSLIAFDNQGNDLLIDKSISNNKIIAFIINKINQRITPKKTSFWKNYLKEVRPDIYKFYYN
ncbi:hypothetical protein [Lacinutrix sp. 5H-3-7-4]|uniref:hypothetical protein n=1 Tax=Lacinutrix sp. (strain 5H-3-7-4) TaxID=983544 RepID=UPI00020A3BEA|nr:hypothetical protein [Lacinutrix sp. 5H-3-7-4]AEH02786.1 hypothetical protein Lacal_2948 [Lacinutrix sp. 5H-3-7-4]